MAIPIHGLGADTVSFSTRVLRAGRLESEPVSFNSLLTLELAGTLAVNFCAEVAEQFLRVLPTLTQEG